MLLTEIDHVAIAVHDLEAAIGYHERVFGATVTHREVVERDGVEEALLRVGHSYIQLTTATRDDSPVAKFLAKRGEGIHHVAYRVDDIDAALRAARDAGLRLIDEAPRDGIRGSRVAFLHPASTGGVLTEIVQPPEVH